MKKILWHWCFGLLLILLTVFYVKGIPSVPFHPDESTYLFTSSDFELTFTHPTQLFWQKGSTDLRQHYRMLDAPLSVYWIGIGRSLASLPALGIDWDWSKSWTQNLAAGAYPPERMLFTGRLVMTLLIPVSLICLYLIGISIQHPLTGWLAALLMGVNGLVLLHARRVMTESLMLLAVTLTMLAITQSKMRPWLVALSLGLALNAKQSTLGLVPVGYLAVILPCFRPFDLRKLIYRTTLFAVILLGMTYLVNPFLWADPVHAAAAAWQSRAGLLGEQVAILQRVDPGMLLDSPLKRAAGLVIHLFITPPMVADVANYVANTRQSAELYLASPGNDLLRGWVMGGVMLVFTLFGVFAALLQAFKANRPNQNTLNLFLLAGLVEFTVLVVTVPLPVQRYALPLLPFACFWISYGIDQVVSSIRKRPSQTEK